MTESRDTNPRPEAAEVSARPEPTAEDRKPEGKDGGAEVRPCPAPPALWRYSHFLDGITGKLFIGFNIAGEVFFVAVIIALVYLGCFFSSELSFFSYLCLLGGVAFCIFIISYISWDLSKYQLCKEGIVVKTWFSSRIIVWSEVQKILIYTFYKGQIDCITVVLNGGEPPGFLDFDNAYLKRKKIFLVRLSEERLAEFEHYWPVKIIKGKQYGVYRE